MSRHQRAGDGGDAHDVDDAAPFGPGCNDEPTCSVCDKAIELDPTCDNSEGPLYCEPCHDEEYPS